MSAKASTSTPPDTVGVFHGLPDGVYRAMPGVSQSELKRLIEGPATARWNQEHPLTPTAAMRLGTVTHIALLEPSLLESSILVSTNKRVTYKDEEDAFECGRIPLTDGDLARVMGMRKAVHGHPVARELLDHAEAKEVSIQWEEEGGLCKARLDAWLGEWVVDLKTTAAGGFAEFQRTLWAGRYDLQAAHYLTGAEHLGVRPQWFVWIVVENEPPHRVFVYTLDRETRGEGKETFELAQDQRLRLLRKWRQCEAEGWTDPPAAARPIELPGWAFKQAEEGFWWEQ